MDTPLSQFGDFEAQLRKMLRGAANAAAPINVERKMGEEQHPTLRFKRAVYNLLLAMQDVPMRDVKLICRGD
jgi:hypothetical protein